MTFNYNGHPIPAQGFTPSRKVSVTEVDEIDQMLFDAGCMALSATTPNERADVDRKITDARVKLQLLRDRLGI